MKMFILWFFAVLGFIFFWIIVGVIYFVVADPFNLRPIIKMLWQETAAETVLMDRTISETDQSVSTETNDVSENPTKDTSGLNAEQSAALKAVGLGTDAITSITAEQEACFVKVLGQARVNAVKAGAVPTASEFFSVRGCL